MSRNEEEMLIFDALSQVETPPWDPEPGIRRALEGGEGRRGPRRLPRAALIAAALVLALAVGAAAVAGLSGAWRYFVGDAALPPGAVTVLGISQTAGDYTLTVEDAMADDNGALLLLALRRADGGPIEPEAHLQGHSTRARLLVDGGSIGGGGGFDGAVLSENGATRYFYYELRSNQLGEGESIAGQELTFTAEGVAVPLYSDGSFGYRPGEAVDLSPLAGAALPDFTDLERWYQKENSAAVGAAVEALDISLPLPLDEGFPQYRVRGAAIVPEGLAVAITQGRGRSGDYACSDVLPETLVDTRDGARYGMREGCQIPLSGGEAAMLWTFRDCPLTAEDLPYLRLEVSYAVDRILSEEPFSLSFAADSGSALALPLERTVPAGVTGLHLTELRLSALGMSVHFGDGMDAVFDAIYPEDRAPVLTMKDGSLLSTTWWGGSGGPEGCRVAFRAVDGAGERLFVDTAQVASVSFCGEVIWTAP